MRVKRLLFASLAVLAMLGAGREDRRLLERARAFEDSLAAWNERVAIGDAAAVLAEIDAFEWTEEEERDPRIPNLRGVCLIELGRPNAAVKALEQAIRSDPSHAPAHRNLAIALRVLGRTGRATSEFGQALQIDPVDLEARLGLAEMQLELRRVAEAAETLGGLKPYQEGDLRALRLRAEIADLLGDLGASLAAWRRLEREAPDSDSARRLAELELPSEREQWLGRCLERDPQAGDCRAALAQLLLESGRSAEAVRELESLAASGPLGAGALHNLLLGYQALGDWAAIEQRIQVQEPEFAASWGIVALARREQGRGAAALQAVRLARGRAGEDLDLANLEAVLLAEAGERASAEAIWRWILERDPGHRDALRNLSG